MTYATFQRTCDLTENHTAEKEMEPAQPCDEWKWVDFIYLIWLVVQPPLWKIWTSIGMISNPIYGKTWQPNHQPVIYLILIHVSYIDMGFLKIGSPYSLIMLSGYRSSIDGG